MKTAFVFILVAIFCISNVLTQINIHSPCSENEQCYKGLVCRDKICKCKYGDRYVGIITVDNESQAECKPILGGKCYGNEDCSDYDNATCESNNDGEPGIKRCVCKKENKCKTNAGVHLATISITTLALFTIGIFSLQ